MKKIEISSASAFIITHDSVKGGMLGGLTKKDGKRR